jgi:hypothetical protein
MPRRTDRGNRHWRRDHKVGTVGEVRTLLLLIALLVLAPAGAAQAATAQEAIAQLNAQREANGIPGGITENADWSQGCVNHLEYLRRNPGEWNSNPHDEIAGHDGYTDSGRDAARSSVLASGGGFSQAGGNPWEYAPIHLMQLLAPALSVTGYADSPGACMSTFRGYGRPGPTPPVVYTYPGEGATIYPEMTAFESPFTPGEFVGIPSGATTGPYLYVLVHGAGNSDGRITAATLTGPDGPVEVRTVDNKTSTDKGNLGSYLPSGGMVIPVNPLKGGSSYTATASFTTDGGASLEKSWSFRTSGQAPPPPPPDGSGDGGSGGDGTGGDGNPPTGTDTHAAACKKAKRSLKSARAALKRAQARYKRHHTRARRRAVTSAKKRVRIATRRVHSRCP